MKKLIILLFLLPILNYSQSSFEKNLDQAYENAKYGITWGLSNLPDKATFDKSIIKDDKLIADIKITKETEGVKIISTGYYNTYEVVVTSYRSYESLKKEGF